MNRSKDLLVKRLKHIQSRIHDMEKQGISISTAVMILSEELFISERTIWLELKKEFTANTDTTNTNTHI